MTALVTYLDDFSDIIFSQLSGSICDYWISLQSVLSDVKISVPKTIEADVLHVLDKCICGLEGIIFNSSVSCSLEESLTLTTILVQLDDLEDYIRGE